MNEPTIICDPDARASVPLFQVIRFTNRGGYVTEAGQPVGRYRIIEKKLTWGQLITFMNQLAQQLIKEKAA